MSCKLTIFTPTYNRASLLNRLYNSLINQTNKNFVWLIVDDGSSDNTKQVVQEFINENKINIDYCFKENGGKHTAMDFAHSVCSTEYIACVDSDDYLLENTIENVYNCIEKITLPTCCGIVGKKYSKDKQPLDTGWVNNDTYIYFHELAEKYSYTADTFLIFKTEVVKNYKFPKINNERFITEKVLYNQFMFNYQLHTLNTVDYIAEYQIDGYTAGALKLMFNNPMGVFYAFKSDTFYLTKHSTKFKNIIFAWARYYAWKRLNKFNHLFKNELNVKSFKKFFGWILGFVFYVRYKKKQKAYLNMK